MMASFSNIPRTTISIFAVFFHTLMGVNSLCDLTKGCYPPIFDILDNFSSFPARSIYASSTCGSNSTIPVQYQSVISSDNQLYTCNPMTIQPINVADNNVLQQTTYWQSDKMVETTGGTATPQFIAFNFTDEFLLHSVIISFIAIQKQTVTNSADARPAAFSIEKLDSATQSWFIIENFARNCTKSFPGIPVYDPYNIDLDFTKLHCVQYLSFEDSGNEVEYSPGLRYDNYDNLYKDNRTAAARYTASAIRIFVREPFNANPLKSYVAISDVIIEVECKCNGHAETCGGQNNATCNCQYNTSGQQCDSCQPLFNNRSWASGTTVDPGICIECACNNLANSCAFDQVKGYGVCINCTGNSTGDACNSCVTDFYVNSNYANSSSNMNTSTSSSIINGTNNDAFCLACNCNEDGTQALSLSTCDPVTGQCLCKERVTERDCSACNDTFWGLKANNTLGCDVCNCNPQGTSGSTNTCNKTTGLCMCKVNVEGDICDRCKPYTYKFDQTNPDGCTPCDCDPGASTFKTCDLVTGQCSCYSNISGRDCRSPVIGYFIPRLDALVLEPEKTTTENITLRSGHGTENATVSGRGFVKLSPANKIDINFTSSLSAAVNVVLRFEKTTTDNVIFLQGKLILISGGSYNCSDGQIISVGKEWALLFNGIVDGNRGGGILGRVCLYSGAIYNVQITSQSSALLIDSVVMLLDTTSVFSNISDPFGVDNVTRCIQSAVSTVRSSRTYCSGIEYSLAAALLQRAIPCSCVGGALAGTGCDPYSGDCNCLPGTLTPDCTQCLVDHYQFSAPTGCTACGCHSNGSITDSCDDQGMCQCLPNVQGPKCNSCSPEHTGLHTGTGCTACHCNMMYSINNNCSDYSECACQPGVAGLSCDNCQHGYYNLTSSGCIQCACDEDGSTQQACDIGTGTCQCLLRAEGSTCSKCRPGYFGLGQWHPDGCVSCFCWGHSQNCSSAIDWHDAPITSLWLASNPNLLVEIWLAEDSNGTDVTVLTPLVTTVNESQYALRTAEDQRNTSDIFYIAPNKFLGDRKSSYGRFLQIVLKPSMSDNSVNATETNRTVTIILTTQFSSVALVYTYRGNLTSNSEIAINITMRESNWQTAATTSVGNTSTITMYNTSTYEQLMEVLGGLSSLKILAYQGNVSNSALDLLSVRLDSAAHGSASNVSSETSVNNVEMCSCEPGYTGNSCEQCAQGYTRAITNSTNPSSQCVSCQCNGHGLTQCNNLMSNCSVETVRSCDPVTGVCQCEHNTEGDHCETCLPGYYGDALKGTKDDCLPCACPGVVIANETNVFANSCMQNTTNEPVCIDCQIGHEGNHCELCVNGYFGTPENATNFRGACRPCECSGHAERCNTRTGECIACNNNTAGHNCEICAPGYFGNAMNSTCQPCSCNFTGGTGECDNATGACECLPNVSGAQCELCNDAYFNLTEGVGCLPCNCFMNGSISSVCNKTSGQCPCTGLVTGQFCDNCEASYWNVNLASGCDDCECDSNGTLVENGTALTMCDVSSGQCMCALPGIVGRTCDHCSPVSKYPFQHISLIYIGSYPSCELCGECFDSWALRVEEIGQDLALMNKSVLGIWSSYDFQTAEKVRINLTAIEEKLTQLNESITNFEGVAIQLTQLQTQFSETLVKQDLISNEVDMLAQTEQTLSAALSSLQALTDVVQVTNSAMAALSTLQKQFDDLSMQALAMVSGGNNSWIHIQSLIFIVSTPEDRERQLQDQVSKLMKMAEYANQTLQLTRTLYETSLTPGVNKNDRELASILDRGINTSVAVTLPDIRSIIASVQTDLSSTNISLTSLLERAAITRDSMLRTVLNLQQYVVNASKSQKAADKLLTDVRSFKTVAEKAEQTIINSTTTLLEYIATLNQAQNDLTNALSISTASSAVEIPTEASMQQIINQIKNSSLSEADVANLKMSSQKAKFVADQSVMIAQRALSSSTKIHEEVILMNIDVVTSRDLRAQAQTLRSESDNLNTSIHNILLEAINHSDNVSADVTSITQSAQNLQSEIRNVTSCLAQRQLETTNAVTAANQVKEKADSASSGQLQLLQIMLQINSHSLADVSQTHSNLTQAESVIRQVSVDLEQIEAFAQIDALIQELQTQNLDINNLDLEITQLISQLDSITLLLQESAGGTNCSAR